MSRNDAARGSGGAGKPQRVRHGTLGQCLTLFASPALARATLADLLAHAPSSANALSGVFVLTNKKGEQRGCSPFAGGFFLCGGYASAFAVTTKVVLAGMLLALPQNAPLLLA